MQMNIRQAARWAERNGALVRMGRDGQPNYLYAVYDAGTHLVECIGSYEKCEDHLKLQGSNGFSTPTHSGRYLRREALESICSDLHESDGEARCIPEAGFIREWA